MTSTIHVPRVVKAVRHDPQDSSGDRRLAHHGYFYSWKMDAMIAYRGTLAFDFLVTSEANPDVLSIAKGGAPLAWYDGEGWRQYIPRYSVTLRDGPDGAARTIAVEVASSVEEAKRAEEFHRLRVEARRNRRSFQVFTEKQVRVEPRLSNCKLILQQAGRHLVPIQDVNLIRQVAYGTATFSVNELVRLAVLPYGRAYSAALNMVATGELSIELDRPIDGDSRIGRGLANE
jgi:hypothetical protein